MHRYSPRSRQRGAVLLLAVLLLVIASSFMLLQGLNASGGTLRAYRQQYNARVLAQAKQALFGYAAAYPELVGPPSPKGPGYLPCPDVPTDDSSVADPAAIDPAKEGIPITNCGGAGFKLGRYPWRYLGTQLRDQVGERLWYAVSDNHRFNNGAPQLNSDISGTLCIDVNGNGVCTDVRIDITEIIAVIIAPGPAIGAQSRSQVPNHPDYWNRASYLEGDNTTGADDRYVFRPVADLNGDGNIDELDLNDQVAYITRAELMAVVEKRVAGDARAALRTYYSDSGNQFYPNAALLGKASPHRVGWHGLRRGALPIDPSGDGCKCEYLPATDSFQCTCVGALTYAFTNTDPLITFSSGTGICTATALDTCKCVGSGLGDCFVDGPPTLTVTREAQPAIFTATQNNCAVLPPAQPQDLPTVCACTGDGSCETQTSQHANSDISGLLPEWFDHNDWEQLTYYTLSEECRAPPDGTGCGGAPQLELGAQVGINALVATTGRTLNGTMCNGVARNQVRPSQNVCDYLDSDENADVDDTYGQQLRSRTFNDYLREVSRP